MKCLIKTRCFKIHTLKKHTVLTFYDHEDLNKKGRSVPPKISLRERISCMTLPSANKAVNSGFKTHKSPEVRNMGISGPTNRHASTKTVKKRKDLNKNLPSTCQ